MNSLFIRHINIKALIHSFILIIRMVVLCSILFPFEGNYKGSSLFDSVILLKTSLKTSWVHIPSMNLPSGHCILPKPCLYIQSTLLCVLKELALINYTICPNVLSFAMPLISLKLSYIELIILKRWLPNALTLSISIMEETNVEWSIVPYVFSFSIQFIQFIFSYVLISVFK